MSFESYVLSAAGIPVGSYSSLDRAQDEAANRAAPDAYAYPVPAIPWESESVQGCDHGHWTSGDYSIRCFVTNTGDGNPFTGDLVIAINDTPGAPVEACCGVIAELLAFLGPRDFQRLEFSFTVDGGPALTVAGPDSVLRAVYSYAPYPRLAAEWCQV
jgi:hypothetical protein